MFCSLNASCRVAPAALLHIYTPALFSVRRCIACLYEQSRNQYAWNKKGKQDEFARRLEWNRNAQWRCFLLHQPLICSTTGKLTFLCHGKLSLLWTSGLPERAREERTWQKQKQRNRKNETISGNHSQENSQEQKDSFIKMGRVISKQWKCFPLSSVS